MKQLPSETYNVAWFKLADCIARGEKERALGVYRLLSHSFDDPALVRQLHGDILRAFKDDRAQERYEEAAKLYREQKRFVQAAAVYEHLVTLNPENIFYQTERIALYELMGITSKVTSYLSVLIDDLCAEKALRIDMILVHAKKAIDTWRETGDEALIKTMLKKLKAVNETIYAHLREY